MINGLKTYLSHILNESIVKTSGITGGDISKAYKIETANNTYFLKFNSAPIASKMFQSEAHGLQLISETGTIKTPKVIASDKFQNTSFLLLEFIESKSPSSEDFKNLGHQLAKLHQNTSVGFGLDQDNFIGSLPQSNKRNKTWVDFYASERLLVQLKLAKQKRLLSDNECPDEKRIKTNLQPLFSDIKPALLHGDLWGGNYLISKSGTPYLIDPAIYYGHHEVDIAMTALFGGFSSCFYESYFKVSPKDSDTKNRIDLYQLYYLLVHLNLFGSSYYNRVKNLLKRYF